MSYSGVSFQMTLSDVTEPNIQRHEASLGLSATAEFFVSLHWQEISLVFSLSLTFVVTENETVAYSINCKLVVCITNVVGPATAFRLNITSLSLIKIIVTKITSSVAAGFGRHGMPPPASDPDLWPFDLETGTRVASKVGNLPSKFGHARPLDFGIIRHVRDGRTDGRTKATLIAPFPYGRGHNDDMMMMMTMTTMIMMMMMMIMCRYFRPDSSGSSRQIHARPVDDVVKLPAGSHAARLSRSAGRRLCLRRLPRAGHQPASRFVFRQRTTLRPKWGGGKLAIHCVSKKVHP